MATISISQHDMSAFHDAHFSTISTNYFACHFLGPVDDKQDGYYDDAYHEEAEEGTLGFYEDGVKRTLTDEQISIFRHSEIQALLRDKRHAKEAEGSDEINNVLPMADEGEIEEDIAAGDVVVDQQTILPKTKNANRHQKSNKKTQRAQRAVEKGFFKKNVKPDLRKRTWDKVESGMDGLDYDEDTGASSNPQPMAQRRRISYND
ncbi:hypothetical protein B0O99DRAFT_593540 [Bisporella sp. PMI_857]|nr:hypothetical protein B0O99DRAFT_593540 [Bisporella sp. PMI_857]